ncbi:L,D-transpeptidase family protein [Sphingomonas piscis]|uniref:L,D-transpeptidase family protein n=1 Tax=Sphingomonas piscis TaxID=2714943 RepID=A0A6G7YSU3_9SPHN|nr:L,D-transpeptidase family protein [Sphingomonas piscis]QIK79815.1 L,D-transpeptidase family protein [Sphingomonas piscis]
MKIAHLLAAPVLLSLSAGLLAQGYPPPPGGYYPAPVQQQPAWGAPGYPAQQQPWGAPSYPVQQQPAVPAVPAVAKRKPIEPIDLPPAIEQGVDMIFIDPEIEPSTKQQQALLHDISFDDWSGAPVDLFLPLNPLYTELRRGLVRYRQRWGDLPDVQIDAGTALKTGMNGERVAQLRTRLGLAPGSEYDAAVSAAVKEFQAAHGQKADGIAGAGTIKALNLGADHYEKLIIINMERAKRLPLEGERHKYVLVDAGSARLTMFENGRPVDSMKIIVGAQETATPMMAALIRYASVNPYWNVPPELVTKLIAPRVVDQGVSYLTDREYQVLSDWSDNPQVLDPNTIDWVAVRDGRKEIRLRRLPSPANSMGMIKFMLPNDFGIYLHDTPDKSHFGKGDQWISNGCVRLEDARRLATWLFGDMPQGRNPKIEEDVQLRDPVPVYMTYLTVRPTASGVEFLPDHYGRDDAVLARLSTTGTLAKTELKTKGAGAL